VGINHLRHARPSEQYGLTWDCVDLAKRILTIPGSEHGGTGMYFRMMLQYLLSRYYGSFVGIVEASVKAVERRKLWRPREVSRLRKRRWHSWFYMALLEAHVRKHGLSFWRFLQIGAYDSSTSELLSNFQPRCFAA
jgi:hypothetical protein